MEDRRRRVEEELIEALGSGGRIKVIRLLAERPSASYTIYSIRKFTGLRRQDANKILKKLCDIGWVKQHHYGVRKFQINAEKKEVAHLIEFLKSIEAV